MAETLPKDITSYDLLKSFAVVFMIIDHIGLYFFPEQLWWRVFGRFSAPIWLFLIGYARTRDIPLKLWAGAVILTVANAFVGDVFFPLTILVGMMLARRYMDRIVALTFSGFEPFLFMIVLAGVLIIPSHLFVQYGLLCLLVPIYGLLRRKHDEFRSLPHYQYFGFIFITCAAYIFMNTAYNDLDTMQLVTVIIGCALLFRYLYDFKPKTYPIMTQRLPNMLNAVIKFGGRRTLEIYVGHLILFKAIAFALGLEGFGLFEWRWY